jgi:hypothetical protein
MKQMFYSYDSNHDGVISVLELIVIAEAWGIEMNAEKSLSLIQKFNANRNKTEMEALEKSIGEFELSQVLNYREYKEVMDYFLVLKTGFDHNNRSKTGKLNKYVLVRVSFHFIFIFLLLWNDRNVYFLGWSCEVC